MNLEQATEMLSFPDTRVIEIGKRITEILLNKNEGELSNDKDYRIACLQEENILLTEAQYKIWKVWGELSQRHSELLLQYKKAIDENKIQYIMVNYGEIKKMFTPDSIKEAL